VTSRGSAGSPEAEGGVGGVEHESGGEISVYDPRSPAARALLGRHLEFTNSTSPPEDMHALDVDGLCDPTVTFLGYRANGELLAIGALKRLDEQHAELKSMHTVEQARGRGIGHAMVDRLLLLAREDGYKRVSLETGSNDAFAAARSLYAKRGFRERGPYADYFLSPNSTYMTLWLGPGEDPEPDI
jgi:putative acetyltransferase